VVIEDGLNGMIAAKRAGMQCIGLVRGGNEVDYPADVIVENLNDLNLDIF
jgi:beta-phosphoglucomutase-like phosphatase (HAD superfamily)